MQYIIFKRTVIGTFIGDLTEAVIFFGIKKFQSKEKRHFGTDIDSDDGLKCFVFTPTL